MNESALLLAPEDYNYTTRLTRMGAWAQWRIVAAEDPHQPPAVLYLRLNGAIASRASSSARSFSGWPAWPFTQCSVTLWRFRASSSACQSSTFLTGFLSAV